MPTVLDRFRGGGLFARAGRAAGFAAAGFVTAQALRLASNLVLTRLLFPEAFGLMALVTVVLVGLSMLSDVGIGPAIARHGRGDEADFLDTAWTLQAIRGGLLWLLTVALAWPVAALYAAPDLVLLLPAAGLMLLVNGFLPTRIETAARHLYLGRVTAIDLASQLAGVIMMIASALATGSVWALVAGTLAGALVKLILALRLLPGRPNRLRWEPEAARELISFGKWIFLSTALTFLVFQGDKAILGVALPLGPLGIYNIGYFLASVPSLLGMAVVGRVMIPLYRETPPAAPAAGRLRLRRMRTTLTGALMVLVLVLAFTGVPLVALLYDPRYGAAGGVVVAIALTQIPQVIGLSYDQAALAAGDSRGFFALSATRAVVQLSAFVSGLLLAGLPGALAGQGIAMVATHLPIIRLARHHRVWDATHDAAFALVGIALGAVAAWANRGALAGLAAFGGP